MQVIALIRTIRQSTKKHAKDWLRNLQLTEIQAQAILDLQLQRLTSMERDKILGRTQRADGTEIARLKEILANPALIDQIIIG